MKHFTPIPLSILSLCLASAHADAQTDATATFLPQVQKVYSYDDGEWLEESTYTFKYDQAGRVTRLDVNDGSSIQRTESTYDANGMLLTELNSVSDDGGETFTPDSKRVQTYDTVLPNLTLTKDRYTWDADAADWIPTYDAFRRDITRNADGNLTGLTLSVPYMGKFDATQRITNTFDPTTKQPTTFKLEELGEDGEWSTSQYLRNLVWEKTNGQLVDQFDNWREYGNQLKSGTISEVDKTTGEIVDFGQISVNWWYTNGDQLNFREEINYTDRLSRSVTAMKYMDDYGSFQTYYYDMEDLNGDGKLTDDEKTYDESSFSVRDTHGNVAREYGYMTGDDGKAELAYGTTYDNTYDPAYGDAIKETVVSEYDYDSKEYVLTMKIVTESFVETATAINSVTGGGNVGEPTAVYNMQGMRLNTMGKGINILRRGGKTIKVLK